MLLPFVFLKTLPHATSTLFPYTTLFRSHSITGKRLWALQCFCSTYRGQDWDVLTKCRSEEQRLNSSHANISYAVFCLKKKSINIVLFLLVQSHVKLTIVHLSNLMLTLIY